MWLAIRSFIIATLKYKRNVFLYVILTVILLAVTALQPYIYKEAIDGLIILFDNGETAATQWPVSWLIGTWLLLSYSQNFIGNLKDLLFWNGLCNPTYLSYLEKNYQYILALDYNFFIKKKSGELMKTLDDGVEAYSSLARVAFEQLLIPILSFFILLAIAWSQNATLTLACLIIIPLHALWAYYSYKKAKVFSNNTQKSWNKLFGRIADTLNNILTTKSFHQEQNELKEIKNLSTLVAHHQAKSNRIWAIFDLFDIDTFSTATIVIISYFLIKNGDITIGTMLMFTNIINRLLVPIQIIKGNIREIQTSDIKYKALQNLLTNIPAITSSDQAWKKTKIHGAIALKNVSFTYENKRKILNKISLTIKPGEKVALVGHSGAGKSTLAFLLMRFYDVQKGQILIDGIDIKTWDYDNLRSHFGVVWQENILFHKNILDNIRYSNPEASLEEVIAAAKQAHAHDFISALPKKYKAVVGERGVRLSGGEKQRVAIARALLKDPRIVILDEATSALDSITEQQVQKGILNLIKDRTAIIIAHRLSTIQHCDKIVVMEKGLIAAIGTHTQLLKTSKLYQEMVKLQAHGFLPD